MGLSQLWHSNWSNMLYKYQGQNRSHWGFHDIASYGSNEAVGCTLAQLYRDIPLPKEPLSSKVEEKSERNAEIHRRYEAGESIMDLAREYGLSFQRISEIVHQNKK